MRTTTTGRRSALSIPGAIAASLVLVTTLAGCSGGFPADPDGTLARIETSGVLRAGASVHPPQVTAPESEGAAPGGTEVDLVEDFAARHGASVEWTTGSETELVDGLEAATLDIAVAGFAEDSVWADQVGFTRPYLEQVGEAGEEVARVVAVPAGENALLSDLERFLDERSGSTR